MYAFACRSRQERKQSGCVLTSNGGIAASHPRCVILIEASEESGSPHLPPYIDHLAAQIGVPDLIVCLDSGAGNYDQVPPSPVEIHPSPPQKKITYIFIDCASGSHRLRGGWLRS